MSLARVEQIFHQCLGLPEAERQAFLERECGGDEALAQEVRTLLEHSETGATLGHEAVIKRDSAGGSAGGSARGSAGGSAEGSAEGSAGGSGQDSSGESSPGPDPSTLVGQKIGNYEVERVIASGGMGTVLAAIQPGPDRRVALKLLRPELLGPALIQRFSLEVQVMGKLHHPNIAQVYDGGSETLLGIHVPYFAMEFVPNAVPIQEYAAGVRSRDSETEPSEKDVHASETAALSASHEVAQPRAERLDIESTLRLFSQVCDAITHAHLRGVIHRDLKSDNVLVDSQAETPHAKVIDFGIARLSEEGSGATGLTSAGQILGTLETMSPEQARGDSEATDVRTDVYALGVILHQMLTGNAPLDIRGKAIPEAIRVILEDSPRPASEQRQGVRPELDAIILKSLSKDSDQRYESVRAFQDDIHAFLEGRTVTARAPSTLQLLRMNARRHRAVLIPAAIVFAVAVIAAIISTRFAFQASQRAVEARQSAEEADRRTADANRLAYRASLGAAASALEEAEILAARQYLEEIPQSERGWEWRHLLSRLQDTGREFTAQRGKPMPFPMSPDGRFLVTATDSTLLVWNIEAGEVAREFVLEGLPIWARFEDAETVVVEDWFQGAARFHRCSLVDGTREVRPTPPGFVPSVQNWTRSLLEGHVLLAAIRPGGTESTANDFQGFIRYDFRSGETARRDRPTGDILTFAMDLPRQRALVWGGNYEESPAPIEILDLTSLARIRLLDEVEGNPLYADFDPQGRYVVAGTDARRVCVWDLDDPNPAPHYTIDLDENPREVQISDDGQVLAVATNEPKLRAFDLDSGESLGTFGGLAGPFSPVFRPGTREVFAIPISSDQPILIWDLTFEDADPFTRHESFVYPIEISEKNGTVISGGWDGYVGATGGLRWTDLQTGTPLAQLGPPGVVVMDAELLPSESEILLAVMNVGTDDAEAPRDSVHPLRAGREAGILARVSATGEILSTARTGSSIFQIAIDPAGERVATAHRDGKNQVLAVDGGELLHETESGHVRVDTAPVAWSPDGRWIAVTSSRRQIQIRDAETFDVVSEAAEHDNRIWSIEFDSASRRMVTASDDQTVRVWSVPDGRELARLTGHGVAVLCAKFNPDGTRIVSGARGGEIRLWRTEPYESLLAIKVHDSYVFDLEWTSDGETLLTSSGDGTVKVWETAPARERIEARREREQLAGRVTSRVDAAFMAGGDPNDIAQRLVRETDDAREQQVIWQEVLRRCLAEAGSNESESEVESESRVDQ